MGAEKSAQKTTVNSANQSQYGVTLYVHLCVTYQNIWGTLSERTASVTLTVYEYVGIADRSWLVIGLVAGAG